MEQLTAASIQSAIDPSELLGKGGTSWVFQVQKTGLKVVGLGGNEEPLREDGQPEAALKVAWETGHMPWEEILKEGRVLGDIFSKTSSDFVLRALGWGVRKASEILPEEVRRAMRLREKTGEDDPLLVCLLLEKMSYDASQAIAAARRPWDHAQASGPKLTECLKGCRERVLAMLRLAEGGQTTHDARYVNQDIKSQNLLLLVDDVGKLMTVKMSDFGFAVALPPETEMTWERAKLCPGQFNFLFIALCSLFLLHIALHCMQTLHCTEC
mmetsp:Transcript_41995/g.82907  ORF Transcript_41995/g.82907 Transcript_41995/m.82907 type:complete len:269 (+) Transcript_41995:285-1091(+)